MRPDDVVRAEHLVDAGLFELAVLEWRRRKMAVDLAARGERRDRIGMPHRDGQRVELLEIVRAENFCGRHFEQDRLHRYLDRGHRDPVALAEILELLDARIAREE